MKQEIRSKIQDFVKSVGISTDLGYVSTLHRDGLPSGVIVSVPSGYSDGTLMVAVIMADCVQKYMLGTPYNYRNWTPAAHPVFYKSPEELETLLKSMQEEKRGCW